MQILCTSEPVEIELSASPSEYLEIARMLRSNNNSTILLFVGSDPSPYEKFVAEFCIYSTQEGKVKIELDKDASKLTAFGEARWLKVFADNLEAFGASADLENHLHIEYFEGHFYLSESSVPLVCCFTKDAI